MIDYCLFVQKTNYYECDFIVLRVLLEHIFGYEIDKEFAERILDSGIRVVNSIWVEDEYLIMEDL